MTAAIRRECAEAIPLFERRADHLWLARAWHALAEVEWMELQARASAQAYENAAAEAELAGDRSLQMRALGERLGCLSQTRITFAAALEEADRLAEQFPGEPAIDATRGLLRAFAALNDGRRDEARAVAPGALELFRRYGYPIWAAVNTAMFGLQQLFSGDIGEAERLVLAGIAELEQLHERLFRGLAEIYLAQVRIAQGRYADALRLAEQGEHDSGSDERRAAAIPGNSARARAYARLGDIERARAAAATAVAVANACDSFQHQGMAQYALAETLAAAGDFTAAIAAAEEAVRLWTALDRKPLRNLAAALAEQIERKTAPARAPTSAV
jgi:tetratricopeptide (TPR) repeat protein